MAFNKEFKEAYKLKVLIVEDDISTQLLYKMNIESWELPIEITSMGNGWNGIVDISENVPDLVITDLNMPLMDGFSMIKALRSLSDLPNMVIVVVTGKDRQEISEQWDIPEDIKLFCKNPIPFEEIKALVVQLINKNSLANI